MEYLIWATYSPEQAELCTHLKLDIYILGHDYHIEF